jgi:hypothetical protein
MNTFHPKATISLNFTWSNSFSNSDEIESVSDSDSLGRRGRRWLRSTLTSTSCTQLGCQAELCLKYDTNRRQKVLFALQRHQTLDLLASSRRVDTWK